MNKFVSAKGDYIKSLVSDIPADLTSPEAINYKNTFKLFPEEAIYIYSFEKNKLIYAEGWEEVLGYKDDEITLLKIITSTAPEFAAFANDLNDKSLQYLKTLNENLEQYSFAMELKKVHKNGSLVPIFLRVGVTKSEGPNMLEVTGRFQINRNLKFGKVMKYSGYGPRASQFEEVLSRELFQHYNITHKEKEVIELVSKGYTFKEIADHYKVTPSAIEKRIIPLYKRFEVKSLSHLISFAHENNLL
jgi:DNA-binding CsgD family transcriptional regulator